MLAELRGVMPNVRVALDDCFTTGDRMIGVRLVAALVWFWGSVGANEEATRWLGRALETLGLDDEQGARLLEGVAMHSFASGDIDAGRQRPNRPPGCGTRLGLRTRLRRVDLPGPRPTSAGDLELAAETLDRAVDIAIRNYSNWAVAVASYSARRRRRRPVRRPAGRAPARGGPVASGVGGRPPGDRRDAPSTRAHCPAFGRFPPGLSTSPARRWPFTRPSGGKPGLPPLTTAIGRALVASGRPAEAIDEHRRGLQRAVAFGSPRAVAKALEGLAEAMAEAGDLDRAAEVLGTAGALRQDSATPANPTQQRAVSSLVASLRDRLGADAVEAALRRGQSRPVSELVGGADGG